LHDSVEARGTEAVSPRLRLPNLRLAVANHRWPFVPHHSPLVPAFTLIELLVATTEPFLFYRAAAGPGL
jgi:hypothetical protein